MSKDDWKALIAFVGIMAILFGGIAVTVQVLTRIEPELDDVTAMYEIDRVLPGHKVYSIAPIGHGPRLYVVTKDGVAVATHYREDGKHGRNVEVVSP